MFDLFIVVVSGYEYDINDLHQEAQARWLKPAEVMYILQNHEKFQLTQEPPQQPTSNSRVPFFRLIVEIRKKDNLCCSCLFIQNDYKVLNSTLSFDLLNRWIPVSV